MDWTETNLKELPVKSGFRLRGAEMTRLETFADAAFAFAVTMLIISVDKIPGTYEELITALKGVPAFAACFAHIMFLWIGHHKWSRRFGLEDMTSVFLSLILIFVMLVYVYPLRLMSSALFYWISGGWLPSEFRISTIFELEGLFIIYGLGFFLLSGTLALLFKKALKSSDKLKLNEYEKIKTEEDFMTWLVQSVTALASAFFAWIMPPKIAVFAGFIYLTFPVTMPYVGLKYEKKIKKLEDKKE